MKEIKFRAWTGERMFEPYYFERTVHTPMPYRCYDDWRDLEDGRAIPCEIMQYTGLKDKNGKEIYESDIVKVTGPWDDPDGSNTANIVINFHKSGGYTIEWSNGFFGGEADITLIGWAMDEDYTFEIIGNIWQTPELLKA